MDCKLLVSSKETVVFDRQETESVVAAGVVNTTVNKFPAKVVVL